MQRISNDFEQKHSDYLRASEGTALREKLLGDQEAGLERMKQELDREKSSVSEIQMQAAQLKVRQMV